MGGGGYNHSIYKPSSPSGVNDTAYKGGSALTSSLDWVSRRLQPLLSSMFVLVFKKKEKEFVKGTFRKKHMRGKLWDFIFFFSMMSCGKRAKKS